MARVARGRDPLPGLGRVAVLGERLFPELRLTLDRAIRRVHLDGVRTEYPLCFGDHRGERAGELGIHVADRVGPKCPTRGDGFEERGRLGRDRACTARHHPGRRRRPAGAGERVEPRPANRHVHRRDRHRRGREGLHRREVRRRHLAAREPVPNPLPAAEILHRRQVGAEEVVLQRVEQPEVGEGARDLLGDRGQRPREVALHQPVEDVVDRLRSGIADLVPGLRLPAQLAGELRLLEHRRANLVGAGAGAVEPLLADLHLRLVECEQPGAHRLGLAEQILLEAQLLDAQIRLAQIVGRGGERAEGIGRGEPVRRLPGLAPLILLRLGDVLQLQHLFEQLTLGRDLQPLHLDAVAPVGDDRAVDLRLAAQLGDLVRGAPRRLGIAHRLGPVQLDPVQLQHLVDDLRKPALFLQPGFEHLLRLLHAQRLDLGGLLAILQDRLGERDLALQLRHHLAALKIGLAGGVRLVADALRDRGLEAGLLLPLQFRDALGQRLKLLDPRVLDIVDTFAQLGAGPVCLQHPLHGRELLLGTALRHRAKLLVTRDQLLDHRTVLFQRLPARGPQERDAQLLGDRLLVRQPLRPGPDPQFLEQRLDRLGHPELRRAQPRLRHARQELPRRRSSGAEALLELLSGRPRQIRVFAIRVEPLAERVEAVVEGLGRVLRSGEPLRYRRAGGDGAHGDQGHRAQQAHEGGAECAHRTGRAHGADHLGDLRTLLDRELQRVLPRLHHHPDVEELRREVAHLPRRDLGAVARALGAAAQPVEGIAGAALHAVVGRAQPAEYRGVAGGLGPDGPERRFLGTALGGQTLGRGLQRIGCALERANLRRGFLAAAHREESCNPECHVNARSIPVSRRLR
ncbi:hypothetical protein Ga0080559_TMP475 [Salipiger profundus]|uniref:Uncharacterized protein n=1 Tax=Salipiger profundus TaxID=1229727 RepID=A0A1U7CZF8_9RHOB|nr:hypothetical protein Ga0080559_TMP475 [Salipiger profundus]